MIYNCWFCGKRIRERTYNSDMEIFHRNIPADQVGRYVLHDHKSFCNKDCVAWYKQRYHGNKQHPQTAPHEDIYEHIWKPERKQNRI